jgi:hypothetical protein
MLTTQKAAEKLNAAGLSYSAQDTAELARKGILVGSEKSGNIWLIPEQWPHTNIRAMGRHIFAQIAWLQPINCVFREADSAALITSPRLSF